MALSGPPLQTKQREMQYRALRAEAALAGTSLTQVHMQPVLFISCFRSETYACVFVWMALAGRNFESGKLFLYFSIYAPILLFKARRYALKAFHSLYLSSQVRERAPFY